MTVAPRSEVATMYVLCGGQEVARDGTYSSRVTCEKAAHELKLAARMPIHGAKIVQLRRRCGMERGQNHSNY
jgi:hypothetical protein